VTASEFYQLRAVECFTLAEQISGPQERVVMHELALCWLRLLARANEAHADQASLWTARRCR
jgi:hypothetical protein